MDTRSRSIIALGIFLLVTIPLVNAGCVGEGKLINQTWIDYPLPGSEFLPGTPVPITAHIAPQESGKEIIIRINDQLLRQSSLIATPQNLLKLEESWVPETPGDYTIQVEIRGDDGTVLSTAQTDITVLDRFSLPEPDLTVTRIQLEGGDKIRCDYSNLGDATYPEGRDIYMDILIGPSASELVEVTHSNIGADRSFRAGGSGSLTSTLSIVPSGTQLLKCIIDVGDLLPESAEDNNEITTSVVFPGLPVGQCSASELVSPVLVSPADNANVLSDPTFEWSYPDDSCYPKSYTVDISEDPSFADISWGFGTLDNTTNRTWPLPGGTCYYWRVKAYVPDTTGPSSSVRYLCVEGTGVTDTPTATIPPSLTPTVRVPTKTPTPKPDTTPPSINNLTTSVDPISVPPCQPDSVTISAQVSDPSGLLDVKLYIRVAKDDVKGKWVVLPMNNSGGSQYQAVVGPNQLEASKKDYGGLILQYYVKSRDNRGNVAESNSGNVHIQYCVQ